MDQGFYQLFGGRLVAKADATKYISILNGATVNLTSTILGKTLRFGDSRINVVLPNFCFGGQSQQTLAKYAQVCAQTKEHSLFLFYGLFFVFPPIS